MSIPEFELDMERGADFEATINWYGGGTFRAPIEEIDHGYPTTVRVSAHGLPSSSETPVIISGVQGAVILNSRNTAIDLCGRVDDDHFTVPVSTVACEWVVGTGEITYSKPTDITNYTGSCVLRAKWYSGATIHTFSTALTTMVLDANDGSVLITATAAETAALDFVKAYGDIELISPAGKKTRVARLIINLHR